MTEEKQPPKDAEQRAALKSQLQERMRLSIVEQGSYGVMQTHRWLKAYKRAKLMTSRAAPTVKALQRCLSMFELATNWKPPRDEEAPAP